MPAHFANSLAALTHPQAEAGATLVPWLVALAALAAGAAALGVWSAVRRLERLDDVAARLGALEELRTALAALLKERSDLDLRRIEHVLIELRDGQRRLEDSILRATQSALRPTPAERGHADAANPADPASRIIARVLAQGYERVQLVPGREELERLLAADGAHEVLLEARRNGVLCKGRVLLRDGAVTDVELSPAYTMFP